MTQAMRLCCKGVAFTVQALCFHCEDVVVAAQAQALCFRHCAHALSVCCTGILFAAQAPCRVLGVSCKTRCPLSHPPLLFSKRCRILHAESSFLGIIFRCLATKRGILASFLDVWPPFLDNLAPCLGPEPLLKHSRDPFGAPKAFGQI